MKDFDINKVAELAMLQLQEDEKAELLRDMEEIVGFARRISGSGSGEQEFALSDVALREDKCDMSLEQGEALAAAADARDGFFFVPQVVE